MTFFKPAPIIFVILVIEWTMRYFACLWSNTQS